MMLDPATLADIQAIAADIRTCTGDDEVAFWDTLDGATPVPELLDGFIEKSQEAAAMEAAARELAQKFMRRAQMFAAHKEGARKAALLVMQATGETKVKRPGATLSVSPGKVSVRIDNPADVPSQLRRPGAPDLTAIRAQLEAGETVPGASLVTGEPSLSMRTA